MNGMAHFCEHLSFLGTKEFPSDNEYSQYVQANGGFWNGRTDDSNTIYWFTVGQNHLSGALDRFSGFFHSPLFDPSCTMREMNVVDSESKKCAQSDEARLDQLFRSNAKLEHPFRQYDTGNVETLTEAARKLAAGRKADSSDKEGDSDTNRDFIVHETRLRVINWWEQHYCASIMCLVVLGRESLEELTQMIVKRFSPIVNRGITRPVADHPWGSEEQGNITFAKTVGEYDWLSLHFAIDQQDVLYESKPAKVICHLIGHKGIGSLHSYLNRKGWITQLYAKSLNPSRGIDFMQIKLKLTKSGIGKI
jgi:insulysin